MTCISLDEYLSGLELLVVAPLLCECSSDGDLVPLEEECHSNQSASGCHGQENAPVPVVDIKRTKAQGDAVIRIDEGGIDAKSVGDA